MHQIFRFSNSVNRDPAIDTWMQEHSGELGAIARHWFDVIRYCGDDVRESLHDGHPTACVADAAFAYVNAFKSHVNVGFFRGAELADIFAAGKIWHYMLGPNLQHLTTDSISLANRLPVPKKYEIGVIIGIKGNAKGYNPFIKVENDMYLTPKSTRLGTEKESYYIKAGHSMIIHNKKVLKLILKFLEEGTFK